MWGRDCDSTIGIRWQNSTSAYTYTYNPENPASFGGVDAVYRAARNDGKYKISRNKIKEWLKNKIRTPCINPYDIVFKEIVIVGAMDEEWEADLVTMDSISKAKKGYIYILKCP